MPEITPNLGLKKPLGNESVNRASYRENLDILEAADKARLAENIGPGVQSGLNVFASGAPDRNVHVQPGVAYLPDGSRKVYSVVTDVQLQAAHAVNPRKDMIFLDQALGFVYAAGVPSATPAEPALPAGGIKLCVIDVPANDNAIDQAQITDARVLKPTLTGLKQTVNAHLADAVQRSVNVKSAPYNAVGDGVTDDTAAIKAALDAAKSITTGAIVYFPPGKYIVDNLAYDLASGMVIQGAGKDVTILKTKNGAAGTKVFSLAGSSIIRDLTIGGNKSNQTVGGFAIVGFRISGAYLENVKVTNQFGIGIGLSESWDCVHINCEVYYSGNHQPGFWSSFDTDVDPYNRGGHKYVNCISMYNDIDGLLTIIPRITVIGGKYNSNGLNPTGGAIGGSGIYNGVGDGNTRNPQDVANWMLIGVECRFNKEFGLNGVLNQAIIEGGKFNDNDLAGINIRTGSSRVTINGTETVRNGNNPTTSFPTLWSHSGIAFDGTTFLTITGCSAYDDRGASSTQKYGIEYLAQSASSNVVVVGNGFKFNKTDDKNIDPNRYNTANLSAVTYEHNGSRRKRGKATISGSGSPGVIFGHGLGVTPDKVIVTPGSTDAKGNYYVTVDAAAITVIWATPPPAGTNNIVLWWEVEG